MTGTVPHEDIRLIATDLDGTFLGAGGGLVPRNVEAVRAAAARGITIVVATGRPYRWTDVIDPLADIHPLLLSSNGAVIADPATGRVLHHWPIDPADGLAFGAALVRRVPDAGFAVEFASHGWGADARYVAAHPEGEPDLVAPLADLMAFDDVVKLLALSPSTHTEALAAAAVEPAAGRIDPTFSFVRDEGLVECSAPGVSKASALKVVMAERGIDSGQAMAFGDMPNDLPMLRLVGHPYVMANGHRIMLEAGFPIAGYSDDGAVGAVIDRMLHIAGPRRP
ncbi:HAD family hydrolase [Propionibacterium freudenreichii]|uniref:HAD family hydrolase n=1 Tax=Propionibacterium freudenreichii TaxID=1744 RepID=UPI0005A5C33B|nr:HAD family hydrolase [Propionibacterium freudenreichii]MDK9348312.1 HAD family phosphatase [Propionibacterium freudenreichii]MDK9627846.1 HAD family phosphatase [Propionibacterium freudenreichii]MDK9652225.1 HAD family phosphatase [Propionibacterium freudenreichii]CEI29407.1 Cof-like hydrolase [Propionibacterium freudenreichii]SBN41057.1 HAD-superfamily hydrolase, subfamily IIB [Propionibacterium freudenreichii]